MTKREKGRGRGGMLIAGLCLAGALLVPFAVYLFGSTLMGPYEGEAGLAGFLAAVFSDVFRARAGALALVLSPAAFVLLWWLIFHLLRQPQTRPTGNEA
jgi:hypothetical protein